MLPGKDPSSYGLAGRPLRARLHPRHVEVPPALASSLWRLAQEPPERSAPSDSLGHVLAVRVVIVRDSASSRGQRDRGCPCGACSALVGGSRSRAGLRRRSCGYPMNRSRARDSRGGVRRSGALSSCVGFVGDACSRAELLTAGHPHPYTSWASTAGATKREARKSFANNVLRRPLAVSCRAHQLNSECRL